MRENARTLAPAHSHPCDCALSPLRVPPSANSTHFPTPDKTRTGETFETGWKVHAIDGCVGLFGQMRQGPWHRRIYRIAWPRPFSHCRGLLGHGPFLIEGDCLAADPCHILGSCLAKRRRWLRMPAVMRAITPNRITSHHQLSSTAVTKGSDE